MPSTFVISHPVEDSIFESVRALQLRHTCPVLYSHTYTCAYRDAVKEPYQVPVAQQTSKILSYETKLKRYNQLLTL